MPTGEENLKYISFTGLALRCALGARRTAVICVGVGSVVVRFPLVPEIRGEFCAMFIERNGMTEGLDNSI